MSYVANTCQISSWNWIAYLICIKFNTLNLLRLHFHYNKSEWSQWALNTAQLTITPFTKTSPNYPHKNNADNSITIAFTNSELPKIIRTLFTSAHWKKTLKKRMNMRGRGDLWPRLGNYLHYFGIAFTNPKSGPDDADNCSIEKVRIILVPFRFYNQIMRILSA